MWRSCLRASLRGSSWRTSRRRLPSSASQGPRSSGSAAFSSLRRPWASAGDCAGGGDGDLEVGRGLTMEGK